MAEFARGAGVDVEVSTFEAWDAAGRRFDAVVAGTAWHWVDPVAGAAKAAEVLRPGGLLAPFWHVFETPPEVTDATAAAFQRVAPGSPFISPNMRQGIEAYQPLLTRAADGIRAAGGFAAPQQWRYDWTVDYTRDQWQDQMPTTGALTRLSPDQVAEVVAAAGTAIDALGGRFTMRYATFVVAAVRDAN
jgi:SAM-dependent methyltransferase